MSSPDEGGVEASLEELQVELSWVGLDELPIYMANQFVSQFTGDDFIVSAGQLAPPLILGSPDEQAEQARRLEFVPVRPLCRFALTPARMRALIHLLQQNLANYEAQKESQ